tara:strand:- start:242 stop:439 length:198 start_codon:yes stop_codon:yes gene_type:complete
MKTDTGPTIFKVLLKLKTGHSLITQQKQFCLKTERDLETLKQIQTVALDIVEIASELKGRRIKLK